MLTQGQVPSPVQRSAAPQREPALWPVRETIRPSLPMKNPVPKTLRNA